MRIKEGFTILLIAAFILSGGADVQGQNNKIPFEIDGSFAKVEDSAKVYLQYSQNKKSIKDSVIINKGKYKFTGYLEYPVHAFLVYEPNQKNSKSSYADYISFYLEKGEISIVAKDTLANAVISGGPVNKESNDLKEELKTTSAKIDSLYNGYYSLSEEERKDSLRSKQFKDKLNEVKDDQKNILKNFLDNHSGTIVSLDALQQYAGYNPEYATTYPLFVKLDKSVQGSFQGVAYLDRLEKLKNVGIGNNAPLFSQSDTSGKPISLSSFKGKYVLLDFWASWCGPCRAENPNVVKNFKKYNNKNFTVLSVSLDKEDGKEKWLKAIHDDSLTWTHVSDLKYWDNSAAKLYGVGAIPQNFLIDPDGKIVAKNIRGEELDKKLSEFLNKN